MVQKAKAFVILAMAYWLVALHGGSVYAEPKLTLDRVEIEPSPLGPGHIVRTYASAITLEGGVIPVVGKNAWQLFVGKRKIQAPYLATTTTSRPKPVAIAFVVAATFEFSQEMPSFTEAIQNTIATLPKDSKVWIASYSETTTGGHRPQKVRTAKKQLQQISPETVDGEAVLLQAVNRALSSLKSFRRRHPEEYRPMIVVLSNGVDSSSEKEKFFTVARRAHNLSIPIHSMAYSPSDNRYPLLGLGTLSKISRGTFRWIRSEAGISPQFANLSKEIAEQYIISFFTDGSELPNKKLTLHHGQLISNPVRATAVSCGTTPCAQGAYCAGATCVPTPSVVKERLLFWLWRIGLALLALLGLSFIAAVLTSRSSESQHGEQQQGNNAKAPRRGSAKQGNYSPTRTKKASKATTTTMATVTCLSGPSTGKRFSINDGTVIGKQAPAQIVIADSELDNRHARFKREVDGAWMLLDCGSKTGTYVGGKRIKAERIASGQLIRVGVTELRFQIST